MDLTKPVWLFGNKPLPTTLGTLGFIYKITRLSDGKFYIGKKLLLFKKRQKRKGKRDKLSLVPSDWKTYWGSSNELLADIEKLTTTSFKREIVRFCNTKWDLAYEELKLQMKYDVMNPKTNTYNGILSVRLRKRK